MSGYFFPLLYEPWGDAEGVVTPPPWWWNPVTAVNHLKQVLVGTCRQTESLPTPHQLFGSYFLSREKRAEPPVTVSEDNNGGNLF